jgi:amidase
VLDGLGHHVEQSYPSDLDDPTYIENFLVRWGSGLDWNIRYWERELGRSIGAEDVEPCTWALVQQGRTHTAGDLLLAIEQAQLATRRIASWWADDGFDLLLTPTCGEPAPRLGEHDPLPDNPLAPILRAIPFASFTAVFNTTGQPAISLPLHQTADGLPVGVQLVAEYGREDVLLRIAAQIEQAAPWAERRPPVSAATAGSV